MKQFTEETKKAIKESEEIRNDKRTEYENKLKEYRIKNKNKYDKSNMFYKFLKLKKKSIPTVFVI